MYSYARCVLLVYQPGRGCRCIVMHYVSFWFVNQGEAADVDEANEADEGAKMPLFSCPVHVAHVADKSTFL